MDFLLLVRARRTEVPANFDQRWDDDQRIAVGNQTSAFSAALGLTSCGSARTRSATVRLRSSARHAASAAHMARAMPQVFTYSFLATLAGPHWRISLHWKALSSPSMACTTSSIVISVAGLARR